MQSAEADASRTVATEPARAGRRRSGTARVIGAALASIALFVCYLRISQTAAVDSDGAANALQAWDMLHGNLLLHGWIVSDVSFYTTELPEYMLIELVRGLTPGVVHLAGAMTYTLVLLLGAALAKGRATGRNAAMRVGIAAGIMLAPQLGTGAYLLLFRPDHIGTAVPILAVWLIADRAPHRWYVPVLIGLLLAWTQVADALATYAAAMPLAVVCGIRAYRELVPADTGEPGEFGLPSLSRLRERATWAGYRERALWARYDVALATAAVMSVLLAHAAARLLRADGGYTEVGLPRGIVGAGQMSHQVWIGLESVLMLFGANIFGQPFGRGLLVAAVHLGGVGVAVWAVARGARRFFAGCDLTEQVLVTGIAITLAAFLLGWPMQGRFDAHEIAVLLPMAAALAGRLLASQLMIPRAIPIVALALAANLFALGYDAVQPVAAPANLSLTHWLTAHHLRAGLAPYWEADSVGLDSHGTIAMGAVLGHRRGLDVYGWETYRPWYDPRSHSADFVVTVTRPATETWYATPGEAISAFGPPARTYRYGRYVIQVWHKNLLPSLHHWYSNVSGA
jgi:hypothetical protein